MPVEQKAIPQSEDTPIRDVRRAYFDVIEELLKLVTPNMLTVAQAKSFEKIKDDHSWDGLSCSCGGGWLVGHRDGCPEAVLTEPVTGEAEPVANPFDLTMTQFLDKMAARGVSFTTPGQAAVVLDWAYATFRAYASPVLPTTAEAEGMVLVPRAELNGIIASCLADADNISPSGYWPASGFTEVANKLAALLAAAPPAKSPPSQEPAE